MPCDFGAHETHNICSVSCVIREDRSISAGLRDRSLTWTRGCRPGWLYIQQRSVQDVWHNLIIHIWALKCVCEYGSAPSHVRVPSWTTQPKHRSRLKSAQPFCPTDRWFLTNPAFPGCSLVPGILAAAGGHRGAGCQLLCCSSFQHHT